MNKAGFSLPKCILALCACVLVSNAVDAQGRFEETAEQRIERLRNELVEAEAEAEAEAKAQAEQARAEPNSKEGVTVNIPTGALVIVKERREVADPDLLRRYAIACFS